MAWSPRPLWRSPSIRQEGRLFAGPFLFPISLENAGKVRPYFGTSIRTRQNRYRGADNGQCGSDDLTSLYLGLLRSSASEKRRSSDLACSRSTLFLTLDLPCRIVRDIKRGIATGTGQRRHGLAGEWLFPGHSFVLAGAAHDDVGPTVHFRLRLVDIARIKGREDLVTVVIGEHAGTVDVFLVAELDVERHAACGHLVEHLLSLHVLRGPHRLQHRGLAKARIVQAQQRPEDEMRHVRCGSPRFNRIRQAVPRHKGHHGSGQKHGHQSYLQGLHWHLPDCGTSFGMTVRNSTSLKLSQRCNVRAVAVTVVRRTHAPLLSVHRL